MGEATTQAVENKLEGWDEDILTSNVRDDCNGGEGPSNAGRVIYLQGNGVQVQGIDELEHYNQICHTCKLAAEVVHMFFTQVGFSYDESGESLAEMRGYVCARLRMTSSIAGSLYVGVLNLRSKSDF